MPGSGNFVLHGGDTAFANRQKLLFDKLSNAEKECNMNHVHPADLAMADDQMTETLQSLRTRVLRKYETKRFRGKESIFKRPDGPAPRSASRSIPDHRRNPHKWVKYSLDDVSNDDMTDRSNTKAALSFLKELKARKISEQADSSNDQMDIDETRVDEQGEIKPIYKVKKITQASLIEFQKPDVKEVKTGNSSIVDCNDKAIFRSSKIIMPEYVVGQKQKRKPKQKPVVKVDHTKQLRLDHLQELDEEEN